MPASPRKLAAASSGQPSATAKAKAVRSRGRPPIISSERLLQVAREVFLELGIRATSAEVAARAGIAEGTIFHRFKSKAELFRAAMNFDPDSALALSQALLQRAGSGEIRQALLDFSEHFMEFGRVAMPVMMMAWSNPESMCAEERGAERTARFRKVIGDVASYFAAESAAGRLRIAEPEVVARMLIGSLQHYCMMEVLVGAASERLSHRQFAEHVVDVLLASGPGQEVKFAGPSPFNEASS